MNTAISLEKKDSFAKSELNESINELVGKLSRWHAEGRLPGSFSMPIFLHLDNECGRVGTKLTVRGGQLVLSHLESGLAQLGFWLDRRYDDREREFYFRYPHNTSIPAFQEGCAVLEQGVSPFPAEMFRDNYQRLKFSEFIGIQSAEVAELHQQMVSEIEANIKIYSGQGLIETEETIAKKLDHLLPDAGIDEVEVLRKPGSSIYRVNVSHNLGWFNAFFVVVEAA